MIKHVFAAALFLSFAAPVSAGQFAGKVVFTEAGCEKKGECDLKDEFGFVDSAGTGWQASADNKTDGASIPKKLQPHFGYSFDEDLVRAAIIHDHYCDRHVRTWGDTHWVFYDALLASGVERRRAQKMYAGVLLGGPKWIWLIRGMECPTGKNCIQQVPTASLPGGGTTNPDHASDLSKTRLAVAQGAEIA